METKFISLNSGPTQRTSAKAPQPALNTDNAAEPRAEAELAPKLDNSLPAEATYDSKIGRLPVSEKALEELVSNLNQHVQANSRELHFSIDKKYGRPIVSVIDKETDRVIRQIPAEVALQVADAIDVATGVLLSEHA